jgi:hypothetical protein
MALYDVVNPDTGETKVIEMSVHDIQQWYEDNKPWKRDWSKGCAIPAEAGEWKDTLMKRHPGWKDVLKKVEKAPGAKAKNLY